MAGTIKVGTFKVQTKQTLAAKVTSSAKQGSGPAPGKGKQTLSAPRSFGKYAARLAKTPLANPMVDTTAPSVPANMRVTGHTSTSVSLAWDASADDVGVATYRVQRDGVFIASVPGDTLTYTDSGLASSTTFAYAVKAQDAALNRSDVSNAANGTTDAPAGDTTPPSAPTGLAVTGHTSSTVSLGWTASTDNVAVTGYLVYREEPLTTAEVTCDVDPNGSAVTVYVEYGTTPDFGSNTGSIVFSTHQEADIEVPGLAPNTVYFYRFRCTNSIGTSVSDTDYFITPPAATGNTYYVSTTGTSGGSGTSGSPKDTIQHALALCNAAGGDTVIVKNGSYATQTITSQFTGLTLIKPDVGATVNLASVVLSSAQFVAFQGINTDAHGMSDADGTHCWEAFGSSTANQAQDLYWLDGNITAIGKTSSDQCIRASTHSRRCYFFNFTTQGGGFGFKSFDSSVTTTDWPKLYWFVKGTFGPDHTWDCWHADVFQSFRVYESTFIDPKSLSNYTNPAYTSEEHHDGIQITGGNDLVIDRCVMSDSHPSDANLAADPSPQPHRPANGLIGGPDTAAITNVTIRNTVINRWLGCALNINGIGTFKAINCTFHRAPGPGNGSTADLTIDGGTANSNCKLLNNIAHQGFISAATPSPSIQGNHWIEDRSATNNKGSSFTTGAVTWTSESDLHLANGTQNAATGGVTPGTDADVPVFDVEGRGRGSNPSKGAYASPSVLSPIVGTPTASVPAWTQIGSTTTGLTFTDGGLTASTAYTYKVNAIDAAGNVSADSTTATGTTDAAPTGVTTPTAYGPTTTPTPTVTLVGGTYVVKVDGKIYDSTGTSLQDFTNKKILSATTIKSDTAGTRRTLNTGLLAGAQFLDGLTLVEIVTNEPTAANFEVKGASTIYACDLQGWGGTLRHLRLINYAQNGYRLAKSPAGVTCGSTASSWNTSSPDGILEHLTAHAASGATGSALVVTAARNVVIGAFDPGTQSTPTGLSGPSTSAAIVFDGSTKTDVQDVFIDNARDDATTCPLASLAGTYTYLAGTLKRSGIRAATFLNTTGSRPEKPLYFKLTNGTLPGSETAANCTNDRVVAEHFVLANALAQHQVNATFRDGATRLMDFEVTRTVYDPAASLALWTPSDVSDIWPNGIDRFIHVNAVNGPLQARPTVYASKPGGSPGDVPNKAVIDSTWTHLGGVQPDGVLNIEGVVFDPDHMQNGTGNLALFQSNIKNGGIQVEVASSATLSTSSFVDLPVRQVGGSALTPTLWNLNKSVDSGNGVPHWDDDSIAITSATGSGPTTITPATPQSWSNNDWVTVAKTDGTYADFKVTRVGAGSGGNFAQFLLQSSTGAASLYSGGVVVRQVDQFGLYTNYTDAHLGNLGATGLDASQGYRRQLAFTYIDTTANKFMGCRLVPAPSTTPGAFPAPAKDPGLVPDGKILRIIAGVAETFHPHGMPTGDQCDIATPALTGSAYTITRVDAYRFSINGQSAINWNTTGHGVFGTYTPVTLHAYGLSTGPGGAAETSITLAAGKTIDDTQNTNMGQPTNNVTLFVKSGLHVRFIRCTFADISFQAQDSTCTVELWDCDMPATDIPGKYDYDQNASLGAAGTYDSANQHVYQRMLYGNNSIVTAGGSLWIAEGLVSFGVHGDFVQGSFNPASVFRHCHIEHGQDVGAPSVGGSNDRNGIAWPSGSDSFPKVQQGVHGDIQQWYDGACYLIYASAFVTNAHAVHFSRCQNNYDFWLGSTGSPAGSATVSASGGFALITFTANHGMNTGDTCRVRVGPAALIGEWVAKKISNATLQLTTDGVSGVPYAGTTVNVDFYQTIHMSIPGVFRTDYLTSHFCNPSDKTRSGPVNSDGNVSMNLVVDGGLTRGHPNANQTNPTTLINGEIMLTILVDNCRIQTLDGADGTWKMATPLSPGDYDIVNTAWYNFGLQGAAVPGGDASPTLT